MSESTWSLQDAKNKFSKVVNAASKGDPQTVTKRGVPSVVVLSFEDYTHLRKLKNISRPSFNDHLLSMPTDDQDFERIETELRDIEL